jgi:hypothetical protein
MNVVAVMDMIMVGIFFETVVMLATILPKLFGQRLPPS